MCIPNCFLNIKNILKILPHRYPFVLIDRVLYYKKLKYLYAIKNCTFNESFFQGHFNNNPIFPGVLILESMAQASCLLISKSTDELDIHKLYYFVGIDNARFKREVVPGDQILLKIYWLKTTKNIQTFKCVAMVHKNIVCRAIILFFKK
ncbi:3-hydroxyacyl-ACP dehydratase FabZ [Buchnera aphidicola]|uniref:3-hydroxyacyl-ACP dehydratase FabZ n=1 Tax=Buchnera aphidicola TaxID=9 RepID=UPI003BEEEC5A